MLQQSYVSGIERADFDVLGVRLAPLTLGHVNILNIIQNPIVTKDSWRPVFSDVAAFVFVCHFPKWEEAMDALRGRDVTFAISSWAETMDKQTSMTDAAKTVSEYYAYYMACPQNRFSSSQERVPWFWSFAEFLQSELGWNEQDAWGCIVSDAFSYFAAWITRKGRTEILNETERALQDHFRSGKTAKELFAEGKL